MNLLPREFVSYKTKLKIEEVENILSELIDPPSNIPFAAYFKMIRKPYEGHIKDNAFKINRIIRYSNAVLPNIYGVIDSNDEGVVINVKMGVNPVGAIVIIAPTFPFGYVMIKLIEQDISSGKLGIDSFLPLFLLLIWYGAALCFFKYEASKSRSDFSKAFQVDV